MVDSNNPEVPEIIHTVITTIGGLLKKANRLTAIAFLTQKGNIEYDSLTNAYYLHTLRKHNLI
ncbi:MAG: hypothetical protein R2825_19100 [Saprospiraceae bacterium]